MASYLEILKNEITTDPLVRGYSGMTDAEIASDLNTVYRTRTRTTLTAAQVYEQIDVAEFQALADAQKVYVRDIIGLGGDIDVQAGSKARDVMLSIFGGGSQTITDLAAILVDNISRADELGLGVVTEGLVIEAKAWN